MLQLPKAVAVTVPYFAKDFKIIGESLFYSYKGKLTGEESLRHIGKGYTHFKRATELSEDEAAGLLSMVIEGESDNYPYKETCLKMLRSKGYEPESTLIIFKK